MLFVTRYRKCDVADARSSLCTTVNGMSIIYRYDNNIIGKILLVDNKRIVKNTHRRRYIFTHRLSK